jgi:hypothetical protein
MVWYIVLFSVLAVLLVIAGVTAMSRNRAAMDRDRMETSTTDAQRRQRKAKRTQSKQARRKR